MECEEWPIGSEGRRIGRLSAGMRISGFTDGWSCGGLKPVQER